MSGESYSPNMNLVLPGVGLTPGPEFATDLNASLTLIDQHDHSSGSGVQITPSGLNINSDLSFGSNNATNFRTVRFTAQSAALAAAADLGCLYEVGADLYYNDGVGNQIRITQSGGIAGSPGSIGSLTSPASATYVSATPAFVFQSDANKPANLDGASLVLRNLSTGSYGLTLNPPNSMAANYSLTLPSLPASQKLMTLDAAGGMSAPYSIDAATLGPTANVLGVVAGSIGSTQIATGGVATANIANGAVTQAKRAALNIQTASISSFGTTSSSTVAVTGLSVTITTTGRPVYIGLTNAQNPPAAGVLSTITITSASAASAVAQIEIDEGSVGNCIFRTRIAGAPTGATANVVVGPTSSVWTIYTPAAGTYTFLVACAANPGVGSGTLNFAACQLIAYEL